MSSDSMTVFRAITVALIAVFAATSLFMVNGAFAKDRNNSKQYRSSSRGGYSDSRGRGKRRIYSPRYTRYGNAVKRLPRGYRRTWWNKSPYYYSSGVFYRPSGLGFIVVNAPLGAIVLNLPIGYQRMWVNDSWYYSYGGTFYRRVPGGYAVVQPPAYVIVEEDAPVVQPERADSGTVEVIAEVLNVRSGPALHYPVIHQIHRGYVLAINGSTTGWLYVQLPNGEFGWVMNIYTKRYEPAGSG